MLADNAFLSPGECGEMHGGPTFLQLGVETRIGNDDVLPLGVIRYSYGRGWWDEFWCRFREDDGVWVSIDEGDIVIERPLPEDEWPEVGDLSVGAEVTHKNRTYTVQEEEEAECLAFRGELPEAPVLGERHRFQNLVGEGGKALSREVWDGGMAWHVGFWVDPFEVRVKSEGAA